MAVEVYVREYIQVGHRLIELPGKCQQIHGHSMLVTMTLSGETDHNGYLVDSNGTVMDFSEVKKVFRNHLNDHYDHHLLLSMADPLVELNLPGVTVTGSDPCVENIANWIYDQMKYGAGFSVKSIEVQETATNGVIYRG